MNADDSLFLAQLLQQSQLEIRPESMLASYPSVGQTLRNSQRFDTAALFGAMLLDKRLQSNCVRLEALVHLAVAVGDGNRLARQADLADCFNVLGEGVCGRMEDPAEDVFVSQITTSKGNFRVLEGIWEAGTFYLQVVLDIIESMPAEGAFLDLRREVFALLSVSEMVCERSGLERYCVGARLRRSTITQTFCSKSRRGLVCFTDEELGQLGIRRGDLEAFVFDEELTDAVLTEAVVHSPLQCFPILANEKQIALVLPTAVSFTIRSALVKFAFWRRCEEALRTTLAKYYASFFHRAHLLGSFHGSPVLFSDKDELPIAEVLAEADKGRYVHLVFFTDTLDRFEESGLAGLDPSPAKYVELFGKRIEAAIRHATAHPNFREGITLLVHCGIGRGVALPLAEWNCENWNVDFLSAADVSTLSRMSRFSVLKLLRVYEGTKRLSELGVEIGNPNALLNLIGWIESNEGHLVNHSQMPREFRGSGGRLFLAPDFVQEIRQKVAQGNDPIGVRTVDGELFQVRRVPGSYFDEDNAIPIYTTEKFTSDKGIALVYVTARRAWWCHVIPSGEDGRGDYDRWLMLKTWLPKVASAIEPVVGARLPTEVLLRVTFERTDGARRRDLVPSRKEIDESFSIATERSESTVTVSVGEEFELGLSDPKNVSERGLVSAICKGFANLAGIELNDGQLSRLEEEIVVDDDARHMHAFRGRTFRDFVQEDLSQDLIRLDDRDVADLRMGLAFRTESREKGRHSLRSKSQCTKLLNAIVKDLEDELCAELRKIDRIALTEMSLRNHEKAMIERARWARTARANIALHRDKSAALNVIAEHDMRMNAVLFPSRVLIEFGICECPMEGGLDIGELDFARLMAKANAIWTLGGWSDAIHREAMAPSVTITPLGDVHVPTAFESDVLAPFAELRSHDRISTSMEEYEKSFQPVEVLEAADSKMDPAFLQAWSEEFGFTLNELREFLDAIDDAGCERKLAVFRLKKSELIEVAENHGRIKHFDAILSALTLEPRESWRTIPDGFDQKDIQPWRFRRQLSGIRRPVFRLDSTDDYELLIAPGFIRECAAYIVDGYYEGSFPDRHYRTQAIRRWHGKRVGMRGKTFAERVAKRVRELGWQTEKPEIEVKEILGSNSDAEFGDLRRYGDVDVLAWSGDGKRILVIECKHLQFHKTTGEIAEQLSDYRGKKKANGKRDDLLKHLDRLKVLRARQSQLCKKIGIAGDGEVEGWIVFRYPVPMLYSWKEMKDEVRIATMESLDWIVGRP